MYYFIEIQDLLIVFDFVECGNQESLGDRHCVLRVLEQRRQAVYQPHQGT